MKAREFRAVFTPDENGAWNVSIPEVDGCFTWGRSLSEARRNIVEALEVSLDDSERKKIARQAIIVSEIRLPKAVQIAVDSAMERQKAYEKASSAKHEADIRSAVALTQNTLLSLRDVGDILGFSQEGVRKLLKQAPKKARRAAPRAAARASK